jgi:hypothetical protein
MTFGLDVVFSLSIGLGAIIGWIRVRKTDPAFLPFLWLLWSGLINELISLVIVKAGCSNAINYNIFSLCEALLITWQFKRWKLFTRRKFLYYSLQALFVCGWFVESVIRARTNAFNSYFIIGHSAIIVLLSVNMINKTMFDEVTLLVLNPVFLICMGLIVYFTYAILVETFWMYGLNRSSVFRIHITEILSYVNLFTNLLFATATLCIPLKRQYILQC